MCVQATNKAWDDTIAHMLRDMSDVPPATWGQYWPLMMKYLDWISDPECQVSQICLPTISKQ